MKNYTLPVLIILGISLGGFGQDVHFEVFAEGLNIPVDIVNAGDADLYIVEKEGVIRRVFADGSVDDPAFLDIRDRMANGSGNLWSEQGLLGLAFHPDYPDTPHFYVNYTGVDGDTRVSRFTASDANGLFGDPGSEEILLLIEQPYQNHNGGDLFFGLDGYLYIATGDGGSGGDPHDHGQNLMSLLGKLLRIDVDKGDPYAIPPDNPFADDDFAADEIWAYGLRNPWKCDQDPVTGDIYIGDVGQDAYEEINWQESSAGGGQNYGWNCFEGYEEFNSDSCGDPDFYDFPVWEYPHPSAPQLCGSLTGGLVYRGSQYPAWDGKYFFADYCTSMLATLGRDSQDQWFVDSMAYDGTYRISGFGRDFAGELYAAVPGTNAVYRLEDPVVGLRTQMTNMAISVNNPVHAELFIRSDIRFDIGLIYDLDGRLINQFSPDTKTISTLTWQSGVYIIYIQSGTELFVQKLVVVH